MATPKRKIITALVVIGVLAAMAFGLMYAGYRISHTWADSEYLRKEAERDKKIAVLEADADRHLKNETQLAAENSLLKKQNEALAEVYKAADTKTERDAADKFAARTAEQAKRLADIDADANYDSQICGLCADAKRSGFPLSADFCRRCEVNK